MVGHLEAYDHGFGLPKSAIYLYAEDFPSGGFDMKNLRYPSRGLDGSVQRRVL